KATFSFAGAQIGTDTVLASVTNATGGSFQSNSVSVTWTSAEVCPAATPPGPRAPSLVYLGQTSGEYSDPFALAALLTDGTGSPALAAGAAQMVSAVLTDPEDGLPIAGRAVTFQADGASATATTDASGLASASITISAGAPLGPSSLAISFAGDAYLLPSAA